MDFPGSSCQRVDCLGLPMGLGTEGTIVSFSFDAVFGSSRLLALEQARRLFTLHVCKYPAQEYAPYQKK
jgi:hypothetical protein